MDFESFRMIFESLYGLGLEPVERTTFQVFMRAATLYTFALVMIRLAPKRIMAQPTPFDFIVAIMIGSIVAAAVTEDGHFFGTIVVAVFFIIVHLVLAATSARSPTAARILKGKAFLLVDDGAVDWRRLHRHHIGKQDVEETMHLKGEAYDESKIHKLWLERDGELAFAKKNEPKVVSVDVAEGVQTIKIEID